MVRYGFTGSKVMGHIDSLPPEVRRQVLDDLTELEIDPINARGDSRSNIMPLKVDYEHCYTITVGDGRYLIMYQVKQDYPLVWLRTILDLDGGDLIG